MIPGYHGIWRASAQPTVELPFGARSVGHTDLPAGWVHPTGTLTFMNLYWSEKGAGGLVLNRQAIEIPQGHIYLYGPGDHLTGYPLEQPWKYRWLTFDGPLQREIANTLGLNGPWPRLAGPCPVQLFNQLERDIAASGPGAEFQASATAYEILTAAARGLRRDDPAQWSPAVAEGWRRIEADFADPDFSVNRLATELGLHRSRFCRLFSTETGMSPKEQIQRLRLRRALTLLHNPATSIKQAAAACGFRDPAYFSRFLRDLTGMSPRQLRQFPA